MAEDRPVAHVVVGRLVAARRQARERWRQARYWLCAIGVCRSAAADALKDPRLFGWIAETTLNFLLEPCVRIVADTGKSRLLFVSLNQIPERMTRLHQLMDHLLALCRACRFFKSLLRSLDGFGAVLLYRHVLRDEFLHLEHLLLNRR